MIIRNNENDNLKNKMSGKMKNLKSKIFLIVAIFILVPYWSYAQPRPLGSHVIMTSQQPQGEIIKFYLFGSGQVTIDWGDGTPHEPRNLSTTKQEFSRISSRHTTVITIIGQGITMLHCSGMRLTDLDLTRNTRLRELNVSDNNLTELDVTRNTALIELDCSFNLLTELIVGNNTDLVRLICNDNQLRTLDLSTNRNLTILHCQNNRLESLDVSRNSALTELNCSGNPGGSSNLSLRLTLSLSGNPRLNKLICERNNFSAEELNALFNTLHDNRIQGKTIEITGNPGTNDTDRSFATRKDWIVRPDVSQPKGPSEAERRRNAEILWEQLRNSSNRTNIQNFIREYEDINPQIPQIAAARIRLNELPTPTPPPQKPPKPVRYGFIGYTGDERSAVGLTFGRLRNQGLGWYFSTRMTPRFISPFLINSLGDNIFTIDNADSVFDKDGNTLDNIDLGDYSYIINFNSVFGFTQKIISDWMWSHIGGGVSWDSQITSFEQGNETHFAKNLDESLLKFVMDFGLSLRSPATGFMFSGGVRATSFSNFNLTFGVQYTF